MSWRDVATFFFLLIVLLALAGTAAAAGTRLGIEAGLNEGRASWSPGSVDLEYPPSFSVGALVEVPLAPPLSLATGLRYVGSRENASASFVSIGGGGTFFQHLTFHYVGIPLLLRFRPPAARGLFVSAGPEVQYLTAIGHEEGGSALPLGQPKGTTRTPAAPASTIFEDVGTFGSDPSGLYRPWNLAVSGGLGFEFPLRQHRAVIEARYTHGLTDIARSNAIERRTLGYEGLLGFLW